MREHSVFDAPTADFYEMVRTMRRLGSSEARLPEVDGDIYPGDARPTRPRRRGR